MGSAASSAATTHSNRHPIDNEFLEACRTGNLKWIQEYQKHHSEEDVKNHLNAVRDGNDMYATHHAAENGHAEVLKELYKAGAQLFLKTVRGNLAIHIAARSDHKECVDVCLRFGNDMWTKVRLLWIAFYHPTEGSIMNVLPKDMIRYLSQMLMRDGVSFNKLILAKNNEDLTPLEYAMKNNARSVTSSLVSPVTVTQIRGLLGSPLHYAAAHGCSDVCETILKMRGVDVNELNHRGETPLYRACCAYPQAAHTVAVLLDAGADPTIRANRGLTALEEANNRKYHESVQLIQKHLNKMAKQPQAKIHHKQ